MFMPVRARFALLVVLGSLLLPIDVSAQSARTGSVTGTVRDAQGASLPDVPVDAACGFVRVHVQTDAAGVYTFSGLPAGACVISSRAMLVAAAEDRVVVRAGATETLDLALAVRGFGDAVSITAARGDAESRFGSPQFTSVLTASEIGMRPYYLLPQALRDQPGVLLQQTTTAQTSPILRGFTGQSNVYLIDGVRFNVSTWRSGPSQYLAWINSAVADRIEIVRGPSGVQYGSDSLGGTINVLTAAPDFSTAGVKVGGTFELGATTAARSGNGQGTISVSLPRAAFLAGASSMTVGDLRPGGGVDSHAAVTRFLGLQSTAVNGEHLPSSGYDQTGAFFSGRIQAGSRGLASVFYAHESQTGASRYDRIDGGDGLHRSGFEPQRLDLAIFRYRAARVAGLDELAATFSVNRQGDGRFEQTRPTAVLDAQGATTTALGYQLEARKRAGSHSVTGGIELFDEDISATRTQRNPVTGVVTPNRPDVPDGTTYRTLGLFAQDLVELIPERLSVKAGVRYGRFQFQTTPDSTFGVTAERVVSDAVTFTAGTVVGLTKHINATFNASRGFRAPNAADFGSVGLTGGGGFEIAPSSAAALGGLVGSTGAAGAVSTGAPVPALGPEVVYAFEPGIRVRAGRLEASVTVFDLEYLDVIERRAIAFNRNVVGTTISGFDVVRQDANGLAFIAQDIRPIATRINAGHARLIGYEAEGQVRLTSQLSIHLQSSMTNGRLLATGEYLRRMPPPLGGAGVRWSRGRLVVDGTANWARPQRRFNAGDLTDARIGGTRTRASIASYFSGTASDRGLVAGGLLLQTGETLAQVQDRVLGAATSAPLFTEHPGFFIVGASANVRLSPSISVILIGENLADRNYRLYGSGADAPGRNLQVRLKASF